MPISRIVFEYPDGWLEDLQDPISRMHQECFRAFERVSVRLGFDIGLRKSLPLADFAPRFSDEDTLLVSMHTVGVYPNVARLKEAYLPNHYYLDRSGFSGWAEIAFNTTLQNHSVSAYKPSDAAAFVSQLRSALVARNSSKYSQDSRDISGDLSRWGEFIFLPLQVADDVVAYLSDVVQADLLQAVVAAGLDLKKNIVIKLHPMSQGDGMQALIQDIQKQNRHVYLTDASILKVAPQALAVVTLNSGVGFESLILGTPVLCVGKSDYSFVTASVSSVDDIRPALKDMSCDRDKVNSFITFFIRDYTFSADDDDSLERILRRWLDDDYRMMRNMDNADSLSDFFQKWHRRMRIGEADRIGPLK